MVICSMNNLSQETIFFVTTLGVTKIWTKFYWQLHVTFHIFKWNTVLLLMTTCRSEILGASWPQGFFLKVEPCKLNGWVGLDRKIFLFGYWPGCMGLVSLGPYILIWSHNYIFPSSPTTQSITHTYRVAASRQHT